MSKRLSGYKGSDLTNLSRAELLRKIHLYWDTVGTFQERVKELEERIEELEKRFRNV